MPADRPRTRYHHGDLREELLRACVRLIENEGIGAVSLRRVAREAGVSPAAPYHHFADRSALLSAITTQGYEHLATRLRAAADESPGPKAAVIALARAYLSFAEEHRGHFHLMFRPELSQPEKHPAARKAGDDAYAVLTAVVAGLPTTDPEGLALALWSFAHGLAALSLEGGLAHQAQTLNTDAADLAERAVRILEAFL